MPPRRNATKRRPRRKTRRVARRPLRVGRALRPATYFFKRTMTEVIPLQPTVDGWDSVGNGLSKTLIYSIAQVQDYTDFTNLFALYKLNAVNLQLTLSATNANANTPTASANPSQIIAYTSPNQVGAAETLNEQYFLNTTSSKKRNLMNSQGRGVNFYMKLKQLGNTYSGLGGDDYTLQRPRLISTKEPTCPHYGLNMRLQRVDNLPFSTGFSGDIYMKITTTYYIQCKQVQ